MVSLVDCRTPSLFQTRTFLAPVWGQTALTANSWPSPRQVTRGLRSSQAAADCTSWGCIFFINFEPFLLHFCLFPSYDVFVVGTLTWILLCAACLPSEPWNWVSFFPQPTVMNFPAKNPQKHNWWKCLSKHYHHSDITHIFLHFMNHLMPLCEFYGSHLEPLYLHQSHPGGSQPQWSAQSLWSSWWLFPDLWAQIISDLFLCNTAYCFSKNKLMKQ